MEVAPIKDRAVPPRTINTDQYAQLLGVSRFTLYDAARDGTAPITPIKVGRALRWPVADVLRSLGLSKLPPEVR